MKYEYDLAKDKSNIKDHGISLAEAEWFEWEAARIREDTRKIYPERRFEATGFIEERLHVMVFCFREDNIRVISLRKANSREVKAYERQT
jgi:hypothetical protein